MGTLSRQKSNGSQDPIKSSFPPCNLPLVGENGSDGVATGVSDGAVAPDESGVGGGEVETMA